MTPSSVLTALRRVVFWSHLTLGVVAGLVILLMSVTGVLLGFERQLIAAIDGSPRVAEVGPQRLSLDTLLARGAIDASAVASVAVRADAHEPVSVRFRDRARGTVALDPYTGATLETPADGRGRAFFSSMRRWHRWIGAEAGAARDRFKAITGAANLAFLFIVLSGVVLWVPRRLTRAALRAVTWFRRGLTPKARDFNWHNTIGVWSAIPLALIVATAVFFSYRWPALYLDRWLGSPDERAAAIATLRGDEDAASRDARSPGAANAADAVADADVPAVPVPPAVQPLFDVAAARHPAWQLMTIALPESGEEPVTVAVAEGNTYRPDLRTTLVVQPATATIDEVRGYAELSTSRKLRSWVRFGHTGEVFGLPGQFLATLVSLGACVLVWTGLALSFRRFVAWWRRRRSPPASADGVSPAEARAPSRVPAGV